MQGAAKRAMLAVAGAAALGGCSLAGYALWLRTHPSPIAYARRRSLDRPPKAMAPERLLDLLALRPDARVLEIGPGTGVYTTALAAAVADGGRVDIVDVQPEFLRHAAERAARAGHGNVSTTLADAQQLPFAEATFDAAVMIGVLGEIPDQQRALTEARRVVRPGGCVVIGESFPPDPHFQPFRAVRARAREAGLTLRGRTGHALAYLSRFELPAR